MPPGCRVIVAESLGPSFGPQSRFPLLFTLSFMHGKFWRETASLAEEYTSRCTVFKHVPRKRQTC
jgi:hypothetical protein